MVALMAAAELWRARQGLQGSFYRRLKVGEEGAERVEGGTRLGLACRDGTERSRVRGWWRRHEWSSSGSKGRGRDAARRGLGCRSGDETERAASSSWKAMIRSVARRRGDVDARWQDTLLRSSSGSTACVRELGSVWLLPSDRRGVGVGAWLQVVAAGLAA